MSLPPRLKFGIFLAPFHALGEDPTLALARDLELVQWLDYLGFDEAWVGEHHSGGWEIITSPEVFLAAAAERTKSIKLGTGVISLPYHNPLMVADRIVFLDHLTQGRILFGVGPGALVTDAQMIGIEPDQMRPRMEESLRAILQLLTSEEPVSLKTDWFELRNARLQLRPYTHPTMPIAVSAAGSPSGMVLAGKLGLSVLTMSAPQGKQTLNDFWQVAEKSAEEHGQTVNRHDWRLVMHVHLAETREEALAQVRKRAGDYWLDYYMGTIGMPSPIEVRRDDVADQMSGQHIWCIGSPDDLVGMMRRLDETSGGFGALLITGVDWATREQIMHSYELIARYVKPQFQGSLVNLRASQQDAERRVEEVKALRDAAITQARLAHENRPRAER